MRYVSFVIRLWQREEGEKANDRIHGRIEHVQSSATVTVSSLADVTSFIRLQLSTSSEEAEETNPKDT